MTKPTGPVCNLACRYCYYLDKRRLFAEHPLRMSDELLERYIVQHIGASPSPVINFEWHGGEPTTLGLDFFRKVVALQRLHRPPGRRITNGLQTNGTLLDEAWCRFLAAEDFFVGLSLDGPQELHDRYRVTRGGRPTHRQVVQAFRLLQRHRVRCDILCVVHDQNVRWPTAVYRFFRDFDAPYIQFLPLVERVDGAVTSRSVAPEAFGAFLCEVFDEWSRRDVGRAVVQIFDEALRAVGGFAHALCVFRETCGDVPVIEHNGDFFACDHFVDPAHRLGNIRDVPVAELLEAEALRRFGEAKRDALPGWCRRCEVRALCNGGCPKDRFVRTPDGRGAQLPLCGVPALLQPQPALPRGAGRALARWSAAGVAHGAATRARSSGRRAGRAQRAVPVRERVEVQALLPWQVAALTEEAPAADQSVEEVLAMFTRPGPRLLFREKPRPS